MILEKKFKNWHANCRYSCCIKCRDDTDYFLADNSTIGLGSNTTLIELIFPFST
jgi:hypothetical protein